VFLEIHPLGVVHDVVDQRLHLLVVQGRQVDAPHIAIDSNHRRQAGRQVQVGCALFGAERQQLSDIHSTLNSSRMPPTSDRWRLLNVHDSRQHCTG
jgi:hypothetical protein